MPGHWAAFQFEPAVWGPENQESGGNNESLKDGHAGQKLDRSDNASPPEHSTPDFATGTHLGTGFRPRQLGKYPRDHLWYRKGPGRGSDPGGQRGGVEYTDRVWQAAGTGASDFCSIPEQAMGDYKVRVGRTGFRSHEQTGLVIDVNTGLCVDAMLVVGTVS